MTISKIHNYVNIHEFDKTKRKYKIENEKKNEKEERRKNRRKNEKKRSAKVLEHPKPVESTQKTAELGRPISVLHDHEDILPRVSLSDTVSDHVSEEYILRCVQEERRRDRTRPCSINEAPPAELRSTKAKLLPSVSSRSIDRNSHASIFDSATNRGDRSMVLCSAPLSASPSGGPPASPPPPAAPRPPAPVWYVYT